MPLVPFLTVKRLLKHIYAFYMVLWYYCYKDAFIYLVT